MMIEWSEVPLVNVELLDGQHRVLVETVNELAELIAASKAGDDHEPGRLERLVERLTRYAEQHFEAEEAHMKSCDYPALDRHRDEHASFVQQVRSFTRQASGGEAGEELARRIHAFCSTWLLHHIADTDQDYARFGARSTDGSPESTDG